MVKDVLAICSGHAPVPACVLLRRREGVEVSFEECHGGRIVEYEERSLENERSQGTGERSATDTVECLYEDVFQKNDCNGGGNDEIEKCRKGC